MECWQCEAPWEKWWNDAFRFWSFQLFAFCFMRLHMSTLSKYTSKSYQASCFLLRLLFVFVLNIFDGKIKNHKFCLSLSRMWKAALLNLYIFAFKHRLRRKAALLYLLSRGFLAYKLRNLFKRYKASLHTFVECSITDILDLHANQQNE